MNKATKICLCLFMNVVFTFTGIFAAEKQTMQQTVSTASPLPTILDTKVLDIIRHVNDIPGLKSEELADLKTEISKVWTNLIKNGVVEFKGIDQEARSYLVAIQAIVEHVLAFELKQNVKTLTGIIHTPMPATPLCNNGEISKELIDPSIESNPALLFTVKSRTTIIRDYLSKGGFLYIVYPKDGYYKRTEEQQKIYQQELINYPNYLFDVPLNCESIPDELIGATYLFEDQLGNKFVFSIRMTQAKNPQDSGDFGLWLGSIHHPVIRERLQLVSEYIEHRYFKLVNF